MKKTQNKPQFEHQCKKCNNHLTKHKISCVNRSHGIQLRCIKCGTKTGFFNIERLQEFEI